MVDWIDNWLAPRYAQARAKGQRLLLIIDSAPGHKTTQVKEACKRNHIDLCMIPGGCTKYLQPLDLTVNRSFKCRLRDGFAKSMLKYDASTHKTVSKYNMRELVGNVVDAVNGVTRQCVLNGWRKMSKAKAEWDKDCVLSNE